MLVNILSDTKTIAFTGCFLQFYFFFSLGTTECFFLSVMAYDRYLAICRPLHYPSIMTGKFCVILICVCWVSGFLCYPVPVVLISQLPFCGPNIIDHFVCDPGPLFALACIPAPSTELICYTFNSMIIFGPFLSILGSYTLVLRAVVRFPSRAGRTKAFSTCGSHLMVVFLFYGTLMVMYVSPTSGNPAGMQKIITLIYSAVTPLLNPFIYSLRNKDMKDALKKVLSLGTMNNSGISTVTQFVLLGFPGPWKMQIVFFSVILLVYILTLTGNMAIICAVRWDHRLHTPMYMFLANFSFLEIWYVTCTVPNMLVNFLSKTKTISFSGCFIQFYFFFSLGTTECFFLCVMAYDRYLAICHPLHYPSIMTGQFCAILVSLCWLTGFLGHSIPIFFISQLPFCGPNIIDHFLCDVDPLMALSCASSPIIEHVFHSVSSLIIILTVLYILGSYTLVLRAVLKVPSSAGRQKAFSTCGSHLVVVSLFYGTIMVMYVSPTSGNSVAMHKIITLTYSVVTPVLNPLIYSLRNRDMKFALHQILCGMRIIQTS
ncbi:olfactory receptor 739-like protein [Camelus ferus]|nr:olfactory receptor 739-like protein [Camelus ferus]